MAPTPALRRSSPLTGLALVVALLGGSLTAQACDAAPTPAPTDALTDALADAPTDTLADAADALADAAEETLADAPVDSVADAPADGPADSVTDAPADVLADALADALADVGDAGEADADAVPDAAVDTTPDPGPVVGPFDDLVGLTGAALRAALRDRIDDHTNLGYSGDGTAREYMFAVLDNHGGRLECIYTGRTVRAADPDAPPIGADTSLDEIDTTPNEDCRLPDGSPVSGGCVFNTEHSWPKSDGAANEPAEADLHHLFPTWEVPNGNRASYDYGVVDPDGAATWSENGSALGASVAGDTVFEVRPKYRGDVARAHFYFAVRYGKSIPTPEEDTLRLWHVEDPVSDEERARNEGIFAVQHNRNPFVDRPDFVELIDDF